MSLPGGDRTWIPGEGGRWTGAGDTERPQNRLVGSASPSPMPVAPQGLLPEGGATEARPQALDTARRRVCHTCTSSRPRKALEARRLQPGALGPRPPGDPADPWPALAGPELPSSQASVPWGAGCTARIVPRPHDAVTEDQEADRLAEHTAPAAPVTRPCLRTHQTGKQSASAVGPGCRQHRVG